MSTEQSNATNASQNAEEKTCFIVTPIGSDADPIRRHIDGIIDAVIRPELREKGYKVIVPHRIPNPGTITKQIVQDIYNSDLVIVNLTGNNPNVMYELALRHCFNKPLILIAENGTKLPFDILVERTIYYINDAKGVLVLRDDLSNALSAIKEGTYESPIHAILKDYRIEETIKAQIDDNKNGEDLNPILGLILNRLDRIDSYRTTAQRNSAIEDKKTTIDRGAFKISIDDKYHKNAEDLLEDAKKALLNELDEPGVPYEWQKMGDGSVIIKYISIEEGLTRKFRERIAEFCIVYGYHLESILV